MNLLNLVSPWLDNICQIKTKVLQCPKTQILETEQGRKMYLSLSSTLISTMALFRSKKFLDLDTVTLLFLFDKHYPIIE